MTQYVAVTTQLLQKIEQDIMDKQRELGRKLTDKERESIFNMHGINTNYHNSFNPNFYLH